MKILFATSEAHPLIKTGGLADVSGALPRALHDAGHDVRLLLPAYAPLLRKAGAVIARSELMLDGARVRVLETRLPGSALVVWLIDHPLFSEREGNPYMSPSGHPWHDNPERFTLFCRAAARIATDQAMLGWRPDIVHANDWQTGLIPPLLSLEHNPPPSLFTLHNMAYQGVFDRSTFERLRLPWALWHDRGVEFWNNLSFLKGGIAYSRFITTVSPSYAREIQTPAFGYGLDGLLRERQSDVVGILNGIDEQEWNPATDPYLPAGYTPESLDTKPRLKALLQAEMGLPVDEAPLLVGLIGRMVEQKGIDLVLEALNHILYLPIQVVALGSGERRFEDAFRALALAYPDRIAVRIGYDEGLAHRIEAGADTFLMPSRFEPCGLNQMYSLRYGTPPIVHRVGGLADTVIHASDENLAKGTANGIVIDNADTLAVGWAIGEALHLYRDRPDHWRAMQRAGMQQPFSWAESAGRYVALYKRMLG